MTPIPFSQLLHAFFHDWLAHQKNVSHHTVLSYRDSWRLFLRFVAAQKAKSVAKFSLNDLTEVQVLAFLEDIEQVRKSSIGTRNCRLAALHSFFSFVADREPLAAAQCATILRIPNKKTTKREVAGLDDEEGDTSILSTGTSTIDTEWRTRRHKGSCRTLAYSGDGEGMSPIRTASRLTDTM